MSLRIPFPPNLLTILRDEELARVRSAFDENRMVEVAEGMIVEACPPMAPWGRQIIDQFFRPGTTQWMPARREQVIISVLSTTHRGEGAFLAVHLYWALMYLDPAEVVQTLLLSGTYSGADAAHAAMSTLGSVLSQLKGFAGQGQPGVDLVVGGLLGSFGSRAG